MENKELNSLINLLDDTDGEIVDTVVERLRSAGESIIPNLEEAWEHSINERQQVQLEYLIADIQEDIAGRALKRWLKDGSKSILEGACLVSKFMYPDLDMERIAQEVDRICNEIWLELNDYLTAYEKVRIINQILFSKYKFEANLQNVYESPDFFINNVLNNKRGNPISLSVLYVAIAERLQLPIVGVNLPRNFILAYKDTYYDGSEDMNEILFYINPYLKGEMFGKKELQLYLKRIKLDSKKSFFQPCSNQETIFRLADTLSLAYTYEKQPEKAEKFRKVADILRKGLDIE